MCTTDNCPDCNGCYTPVDQPTPPPQECRIEDQFPQEFPPKFPGDVTRCFHGLVLRNSAVLVRHRGTGRLFAECVQQPSDAGSLVRSVLRKREGGTDFTGHVLDIFPMEWGPCGIAEIGPNGIILQEDIQRLQGGVQ